MRKTIQFLQLAFLLLLATACAETSPFKYESVPNDPLKARIYTLDNGLKVYMTVNKETPRIQTYIACLLYTSPRGLVGSEMCIRDRL